MEAQRWAARRLFPLLATAGLIATGMIATTWGAHLVRVWEAQLTGRPAFALPQDLWSTLVAAHRLARLDVRGLYTPPTGLVGFPGAALILVPAAAVIDVAGFGLAPPGVGNPHPAAWLVAGPYELALSGLALLAADALAEQLGAGRPKRALLAVAGAVALGNVSLAAGHPEDAVAVGLLLYGVLALSRAQPARSAWLTGAAVAVQPLVLLALPFGLVLVGSGRLAGYLTRAAMPSVALLAVAAVANPAATVSAVTGQPNWPSIDHTTPWTSLAPHLGGGAVAAGPFRALAILLACAGALAVRRRWAPARQAGWCGRPMPGQLIWWMAAALALRCVLEPVMLGYYLWPALAVALLAACGRWSRLIPASLGAAALTFASGAGWQGPWLWWTVMVTGLILVLAVSHGSHARQADAGRAGASPALAGQALPGGG